MIGNNSLCINANGIYGVLFISQSERITCATCRYNKTSCTHFQHLVDFLESSKSDLPKILQEYAQLLLPLPTTSFSHKRYPDYSCFSHETIPFVLSSEISKMLQMNVRERFNIVNDVAELFPFCNVQQPCRQCNQRCWDNNPTFTYYI